MRIGINRVVRSKITGAIPTVRQGALGIVSGAFWAFKTLCVGRINGNGDRPVTVAVLRPSRRRYEQREKPGQEECLGPFHVEGS